MKFIANRAELLAAAKTVQKGVSAQASVEVLKGILVEADADAYELTLAGTNYEVAIQCKLPAPVEIGGSMVIEAKLFVQMLTVMGEEDVSVTFNQNMTCDLRSGTARFLLSVQPGKNYPKPDIPFPENAVRVSNIASAAKNTIYAAAKTQDKLIMSGVRVEISDERLRACGCDGIRLMERQHKAEAEGNLSFLIPAHSFKTLSGMITDKDVLDVGLAGGCAVFTKENFLFSARLIPGEYIDVDKIMAGLTPEYSAIVDTKELAAALDTLSVSGMNGGSVNMAFGDGKINLSCEGENTASRSAVDAEVKTATPGEFRYNLEYLHEALRRMTGKVEIQLSSIGMLFIQTESDRYFQIPLQPARKAEKTKPKKKATASKKQELEAA